MSNIDYHYRPTDDSDPFQTDIFILSGKKEDVFSPKFNYKGFQYAEISSSKPIRLTKDDILMLELHSDVPPVGKISSSNPTINKIHEATKNSYLSNLFGYPTDCPQREKNGWTGDGHIAVETGLYNFDGITIYEKWLEDFKDAQLDNGILPNIVPTSGWGYDWANGPDWTSAIAIIPWEIYRFYGDTTLLSRMYDNIKLYVKQIESRSPEYTTDWGLGDWVPVETKSNKELTSSLYYYADALILSKAATLLGKNEDAVYYKDLSDKIKQAVNDKFLDKTTGIYCSGSQTEQAAPLYWGIVPDDVRQKTARHLYEKVVQTNFHLDVGLLGSKYLLDVLTQNGYADAAYRIASQETYPSWGWWIVNGSTTLTENWRLDVTRDASQNHIMFGEIGAWLYKGPGGIYPDEAQPGFKHIIFKPNFVKGLDFFEAQHDSPYGKIISHWTRSGNNVNYEVTVPAGSSATFFNPVTGQSTELNSGHHIIQITDTEVNKQ
jgi:alpha-L-rhamnosidase